jgi:hypothetical protein
VQVARFFRGPADGAILTLPKEAISPVFVIPEFEPITVEYFYLLALVAPFWRLKYTNGATPQTAFRISATTQAGGDS